MLELVPLAGTTLWFCACAQPELSSKPTTRAPSLAIQPPQGVARLPRVLLLQRLVVVEGFIWFPF